MAAPSLNVPRGHPCAALMDSTGMDCGATPALLYRRICAHRHSRDLHLCKVHERTIGATGRCRDCQQDTSHPHACPVALVLLPEALDLIRGVR